MKSRMLLNVLMLAVITILGAIAWFKPGKTVQETIPLTRVDASALTTLTLRNAEILVLDKKDGRWSLVSPFVAPANQNRIAQLLDIAHVSSEARYPVKPNELSRFELDKPKASLTLGGIDLDFGGTDPINMNRYVKVGDTLHLVKDNFYHHLTAGATDYVDKKLLPDGARINEIVIPGLKAVMSAEGKWTLTPADSKADLNELAFLWTTARAIDVKRLQKPVQGESIHIELAGAPPVDFIIIQREPSLLWARTDLGLSYEVMPDMAGQLLNLPKTPAQPAAPLPSAKDAHHDEHEDEPQ